MCGGSVDTLGISSFHIWKDLISAEVYAGFRVIEHYVCQGRSSYVT